MKFKIGQVSVEITVIDWNTKRFVVDVEIPIREYKVNVVTQANKNEDTPISVSAEIHKGLPF